MNYANEGAGVAISMFSTVTLANNLIINNSASYDGGAIYCANASPIIVNNTISNNTANTAAGAYFWYSYPTILNSILWGDIAADNTEIASQGGTINISYSDISGTMAGLGIVHVDPQFQDASNGDYRLSNASQLIGAGYLQTIVPLTDLSGIIRPSPAGSSPDIGCYENAL